MSRVYNFSAGPAVLPEEVLKEVAEEMMDYQGTGMSVMEMSHRSADFQSKIQKKIWKTGIRSLSTVLLKSVRQQPPNIPGPKYEKLFPQIMPM